MDDYMKIHFKSIMAAAVFAALTVPAMAGGVEAGLSIGTLGYGPQVVWTLVPNTFDARLSVGLLNYSYNTTSNGLQYNGHLKLQNAGLLADWHPFAGSFHLTAGAYYNDNRFDLSGQASAGSYTFNGTTYTVAEAGSVSARVTFNSVAPYLGLGWSNAGDGPGLHFTSDIGVMYQGKPTASVTATNPTQNAQLAADVAASQAQLQSDLNSFQWYPVLQFGVNYRF